MTTPRAAVEVERLQPDEAGADLVPGWLTRLAAIGWRVLAALALGLVLIGLAVTLSTVTASIVVALIVASTFAPDVRRLRFDRGWDRTKAAARRHRRRPVGHRVTLSRCSWPSRPISPSSCDVQAGLAAIETWLEGIGSPPVVTA